MRYQYRCNWGHETIHEHPMGTAPRAVVCGAETDGMQATVSDTCPNPGHRVYSLAGVTYAGGRERFHNEPSLGAQRAKARAEVDSFCAKSERNSGSYHPDDFELSAAAGKSGVPNSW